MDRNLPWKPDATQLKVMASLATSPGDEATLSEIANHWPDADEQALVRAIPDLLEHGIVVEEHGDGSPRWRLTAKGNRWCAGLASVGRHVTTESRFAWNRENMPEFVQLGESGDGEKNE